MVDSITFRTTDNTRWGAGKGSDLDADEIDINFYVMMSRLTALESSPPTAVGISNIQVTGSQLLFTMSDATEFGPFTLPIAKLTFRGDYVPETPYNELDMIRVPGLGLYMTLIANTDTDDPFDPTKTDGSGHLLFGQVFAEQALIYDVSFYFPGKPGIGIQSDGYMMAHQFVRPVTIDAAATGSTGKVRVNPAAALAFPLYKNGGSSIGSVSFDTSGVATFAFDTDMDFASGDLLQVGPPVALDANARDLNISFLFTRVIS